MDIGSFTLLLVSPPKRQRQNRHRTIELLTSGVKKKSLRFSLVAAIGLAYARSLLLSIVDGSYSASEAETG